MVGATREPVVRMMELGDEAATVALARRIAAVVHAGDVIALAGDLGTGKTRFARAFVDAAVGDGEEVPSPTFTLVQTYEFPAAVLWHFDLYRIERPEDAWELGLEEALAEGISLIEWPERLGPDLPKRHIAVRLAFGPDAEERIIEIAAPFPAAARLAAAFGS